jgi:hypothetical protein
MSFTIGITTFSKRFNYLEKLVEQIRSFVDYPIIIVINGEKDGTTDDKYLKDVLNLCQTYNQIYPTSFLETRGLSKMWNTIVVQSYHDNIMILNDDIEILSNHIFNVADEVFRDTNFQGICKINSSFSHFLVDKKVIESLNYFDERLLGFGEEDGDISYQMLKLNKTVDNVYCNGVINIISDVRHDHITSGIGKYSKFNRDFIYGQKYVTDYTSNLKGMFDTPMKEQIQNNAQYPYEIFFRDNKSKI